MLFFLVLHDVVVPDTGSPIVSMGELLTYAELEIRFGGEHGMDNVMLHAVAASNREAALRTVSALAEQI